MKHFLFVIFIAALLDGNQVLAKSQKNQLFPLTKEIEFMIKTSTSDASELTEYFEHPSINFVDYYNRFFALPENSDFAVVEVGIFKSYDFSHLNRRVAYDKVSNACQKFLNGIPYSERLIFNDWLILNSDGYRYRPVYGNLKCNTYCGQVEISKIDFRKINFCKMTVKGQLIGQVNIGPSYPAQYELPSVIPPLKGWSGPWGLEDYPGPYPGDSYY